MPREYRIITFSADEVRLALRQYAAVIENRPLAPMPFEGLAIDGSSAVTAELIGAAEFSGSSRYVFSGDRLAQALTYWCASIGIPLPRRGRKTVQAADGELQLLIKLEATTDPSSLDLAA